MPAMNCSPSAHRVRKNLPRRAHRRIYFSANDVPQIYGIATRLSFKNYFNAISYLGPILLLYKYIPV